MVFQNDALIPSVITPVLVIFFRLNWSLQFNAGNYENGRWEFFLDFPGEIFFCSSNSRVPLKYSNLKILRLWTFDCSRVNFDNNLTLRPFTFGTIFIENYYHFAENSLFRLFFSEFLKIIVMGLMLLKGVPPDFA